jgi:hypothetical protein
MDLSNDELVLPQANLILLSRFGASAETTATGVATGLVAGSFLPPHAKLIQRFLGCASTRWLVVGDTLALATISGETGFSISASPAAEFVGGKAALVADKHGAKLAYVAAGKGGLGVLVRAGLVRPPSLVSSAVEARLALLIIDLRRDKSIDTCICGFVPSGL